MTITTEATEQSQTLGDMIKSIDLSQYKEILNPESWTNMNLESIIVVFLVLLVCYKLFHKAYKFMGWCVGLLFAVQIFYLLGLSSLNNYIPFSTVFEYDIGVSIANFFSGTKIASWLLWIHDVLHVSVIYAGNVVAEYGAKFIEMIDNIIQNSPVETEK